MSGEAGRARFFRRVFGAMHICCVAVALSNQVLLAAQIEDDVVAIALAEVEPVRLVVAGDTNGSRRLRSGLLAVHRESPLHGIVLTGDNFYDCGVTSPEDEAWHRYADNYSIPGVPIFPVLGNHDYGEPRVNARGRVTAFCGAPDPGAQVATNSIVPNWVFPARNYIIRNSFIELIMTDSQPIALELSESFLGSSTAREAAQWLKRALRARAAPWKIVAGHHVMYSSGHYGHGGEAPQKRMQRLLDDFRAAEVDLHLAGHDHHLELLGDIQRGNADPLYLISGAGAAVRPIKQRSAGVRPATIFPEMPAESFVGFALLQIWCDRMIVTFHDGEGAPRSAPFTVASAPRGRNVAHERH